MTFLLTDIEGSTARWERDTEAMASAVARRYEILDEVVARWAGSRPVEQGEDDSVVAASPRATDRMAAAGERDEGNYFGETVNDGHAFT